ncbi:MAG: hypothetical protein Q7K43_02850 [Candidatus Woesearchaeota archaeon]|nr:hypothetical protein [Candidatus Woesearchaeota archaeon]
MILTLNERKVLRLLATTIGKSASMNDIGKQCRVTSGGAHKILTKLEKEGVVKATRIGNLKSYKLDFENEKTASVLELSFIPDSFEGRVKMRVNDLQNMKKVTQAGVLFGSYITNKKEPNDLDILFLIDRNNFEDYKKILNKVRDIVPIKIQDVVQTAEDLQRNLKKNDAIITSALREGIVLWGFEVIVQGIKNASK